MKPRALDLFCGAGGATRGLQRAGFHVTGVDWERQPNYCGDRFFREDVLRLDPPPYNKFDFIWASPPCQKFTAYKRRPGHVNEAENLIPETRRLLGVLGAPWVIENVPGAPLLNALTLCGSMFGLDVRRHRIFEFGFPFNDPTWCAHRLQEPRFPPATNRKNLRRTVEVGVWRIPLETQKRAMGVDWNCTLHELSQMVPPAYAEYIGKAALARLVRQKEAA